MSSISLGIITITFLALLVASAASILTPVIIKTFKNDKSK